AYLLQALLNDGYHIIALVTQPDSIVGRKKELKMSATKELALKNQIEVLDYDRINDHASKIRDLKPDLIITCAFGQKVSVEILEIPPFKAINVHASLLPQDRGGAPIHYAILNSDSYTGNTIMYMEEGLDTGDMLSQSHVVIDIHDTTSMLFDKMMIDGANLLLKTLPALFKNQLKPIKQDHAQSSFAANIKREQEYITFNHDVLSVYNHIRGLLEQPGCYCYLNEHPLKLWHVFYVQQKHNNKVGQVIIDAKDHFKIACLDGFILVYECQLFGKKRMKVIDYFNGNKLELSEGVILNESKETNN
ncbi:MAG: methionyl-tRNA formyltransferase, partial [Bacilli bacterium]